MDPMDNLIADIGRQIHQQRQDHFQKSNQLSLGDLIYEFSKIVKKAEKGKEIEVRYDFGYFYPTELDSWRGIYSELALNYETGVTPVMNIQNFLKMLKEAVGKEFTGYKGGEYIMSKETPVWVSNYSQCCYTAVVGVLDLGYQVIIRTEYMDT